MTHKYPHVARFVVAINVPANVDPMGVRAWIEQKLKATQQQCTCDIYKGASDCPVHSVSSVITAREVMYVKRLMDK